MALLAGLVCTAVLGLLAGAVGAMLRGPEAAIAVAVGVALVLIVFGAGAVVVAVVARAAPAASLFVALMTYTLSVVLVGVFFLWLDNSGLLQGGIDRRWLGGTVIAGTLVWLTAQVVASFRTRQPLYDLPSPASRDSASRTDEAGAR
jgi:ATP synthase protein I